jgi:hypothetical protein
MNTTVMERPQTAASAPSPIPPKNQWINQVQGRVNQKIIDHILANPTQPIAEAAAELKRKKGTISWYRNFIGRKLGIKLAPTQRLPRPALELRPEQQVGGELQKQYVHATKRGELFDYIRAHPDETPAETAEHFGITTGAVSSARYFLRSKGEDIPRQGVVASDPKEPKRRRPHSHLQPLYDFLRENPNESPALTAKRFGVPPATVYNARTYLRRLGEDMPHGGSLRKQLNEKRTTAPEGKADGVRDTKPDMVNFPPHYTDGGVDTIDYIRAKLTDEEFAGYCKGNALKYVSRMGKKNDPSEDLAKARWYLDRLLAVRT